MRSMPWVPGFSKDQLVAAVSGAATWREVLAALDLGYHGKNIETIRKWADRWGISIAHLSDNRGDRRAPRFTEEELREAIAASISWAETLRHLKYRSAGGNWKTLQKYAALWAIPTNHFDPHGASIAGLRRAQYRARPLEQVLVAGSTYNRGSLKQRRSRPG